MIVGLAANSLGQTSTSCIGQAWQSNSKTNRRKGESQALFTCQEELGGTVRAGLSERDGMCLLKGRQAGGGVNMNLCELS